MMCTALCLRWLLAIIRRNRITLGRRLFDEAHDWINADQFPPMEEVVRDFLRTYKEAAVQSRSFEIPTFAFSSDQNTILEIVGQQIEQVNGGRNSVERVVVQGKAGSGNSTVIKEIIRRITHHLGEQAVAVAGPTGSAAINIEGRMSHSLLRLPLYSSLFKGLVGDNPGKFQREMAGLRFGSLTKCL